ncbi:MAG: Hint domain-containing protein [Alphaproteobacteria bacterium]|nr:Hint domain-containing protein [Alphaproteobacteria bacterium]
MTTVSSQADLNNAIEQIDQAASGTTFDLVFGGNITEGDLGQPTGIYAIDPNSGVSVTIDGNGFALSGGGANGGLAVLGGSVTVEQLTIEDTVAKGGDGDGSGGGGAGLGGGLFVGPEGTVTLDDVLFRTDSAKGGNAGDGGGGGAGGHSSLIVPPLGLVASDGADGTAGVNGATATGAPMTGGAGGPGTGGGPGGFGQPGGKGGDGGDGGAGGYGTTGAPAGLPGGAGGTGGHGGLGGIAGTGGDAGKGGDGGDAGSAAAPHGGMATHGPIATTGGPGGDGGIGGEGGFGAGGGAGGDGGNGGAGGVGGVGGSGHSQFGGFGGTTGYIGPGGTGGTGGTGGKGAKGRTGGIGNFGGGGGGGGNGGDGGDGGTGGMGGLGGRYFRTSPPSIPPPAPPQGGMGGHGGDGGIGGSGGTGGNGGFGGFGGGGGGGGMGGAGGQAGHAGMGGHGGVSFYGNDPTHITAAGSPGPTGNTGSTGADGKDGSANLGGFGGGPGAGSQGGGGLGAGGDIFVAQGGTLLVDGGLLTGGSVEKGTGANDGQEFGNGIFLQGNETITLGATAGETLTIEDQIVDQLGVGGTAGTGALKIGGSGTVLLAAANAFVGGVTIDSGTLELGNPAGAGSGPISFSGDPRLEFAAKNAPNNPIEAFTRLGTIEVTGFLAAADQYSGDMLTLTGLGTQTRVALRIPGHSLSDLSYADDAQDDATLITTSVPCFCRGTLILTPAGEVAVETLRPGDRVVTLAGAVKEIAWVGKGRSLITPRNEALRPIVVRRDAIADGVPVRDLHLTSGHSLYIKGELIPIETLVNGHSVLRDAAAQVLEYYHVELTEHDVLIADGAPAESYKEDGNRDRFHNAHGPAIGAAPGAWFAPVRVGGPQLESLWRRLLDRSGFRPAAATTDPDLHLLADGRRVDADHIGAGTYRFRLAARPATLRLISHSVVPHHSGQGSDRRRLGVALRSITLVAPGARVALSWNAALLSDGFYSPEPEARWRWTTGDAGVPDSLLAALAGPCEVILDTAGALSYPLAAGEFGTERAA